MSDETGSSGKENKMDDRSAKKQGFLGKPMKPHPPVLAAVAAAPVVEAALEPTGAAMTADDGVAAAYRRPSNHNALHPGH